jgi:type II secretory pathway component PulK
MTLRIPNGFGFRVSSFLRISARNAARRQRARDFGFRISRRRRSERGSVLVIVLLIAFGLISMTLYFANSMSLEFRAADNRASSLAADQAIEGAARYVGYILATFATNGAVPYPGDYLAEAVPVGNATRPEENARFWLIGRNPEGGSLSEPVFGLVSESSKLDLNAPWLNAGRLETNLVRMTYDFAEAIMDWRSTNSSLSSLTYSQMGYLPKHAPFESVEELRLVYGATLDILVGEDLNRNGILDANEQSRTLGGQLEPGVLEYFTVYSRDPNTHSDGTALTNVNDQAAIQSLLQSRFGSSRATDIIRRVFPGSGVGQGSSQGGGSTVSFPSLLRFYLDSGMTADEFAQIYYDITVTNAALTGRVNINTAPAEVLACLPGMNADAALQVVNYRESTATDFSTIAWIVNALGSSSTVLQALAEYDCITTKSHQFTADIAAVGPFGRGYRRVKFIFDVSSGTPRVVYRQDLSRLGWALGRETRETWVARITR